MRKILQSAHQFAVKFVCEDLKFCMAPAMRCNRLERVRMCWTMSSSMNPHQIIFRSKMPPLLLLVDVFPHVHFCIIINIHVKSWFLKLLLLLKKMPFWFLSSRVKRKHTLQWQFERFLAGRILPIFQSRLEPPKQKSACATLMHLTNSSSRPSVA